MSKKPKVVYDAAPTLGDDKTTEGYTAYDDGSGVAKARSDTQLADVISTRLGTSLPPANPGDTTAPIITSFVGTVTIDSLVIAVEIQAVDDVGVTGWIIKEDDTDLPASDDSDWQSTTYTTFTVSDYNPKNLTLRTRDDALNVSNPSTIPVKPTQTSTTVPTVDTFTTTNPAANSKDYTFTLTATASSGETISDYILTENSTVQPLAGDAGWQADAGPTWVAVAASLTNFADTDIRIYVKDTGGLVSTGSLSRVNVSVGGDTDPTTGDFLWENNPTITAYGGVYSWSVTDGQTITIDGSTMSGAADVDGQAGGAPTTDHLFKFIGTVTHLAGATINITNMKFYDAGLAALYFQNLTNVTIKIWNNDIGETNVNGIATNYFKNAVSLYICNGAQLYFDGNKVQDTDGIILLERVRSSSEQDANVYARHNWCGGLKVHNPAPDSLYGITFIIGASARYGGNVSENIFYAPGNTTDGEDLFNLHGYQGTALVPVNVNRNRVWGSNSSARTNAVFQIGDGDTGSAYVYVEDNTIIDANTPGQISSGNHIKYNNNKAYTSSEYPGIGSCFAYQHQRWGSDPGTMFDNEVTGNTHLVYFDPETGAEPDLSRSTTWAPNYGGDGLGPNEGVCVGTCGIEDSVNPAGWSNNNWKELSFDGGNGKSILWRTSWNAYRYASSVGYSADPASGLTPSIDYSSPWIGDGGSQNFTAGSVSSDSDFGDGAVVGTGAFLHDVLSRVSGGTLPYTLSSVTTSTPTTCSVSILSDQVSFLPDASTDGAFTYQYTVTDAGGLTATGTVTGTIAASAATLDYFDQDGLDYIAIDPTNQDEYYARDGNSWFVEGAGPYGGGYQQSKIYNSSVAIGDVETSAPELVYRIHFDQAGTYDIYIMGMAQGTSLYDSVWVGWDDSPEATACTVPTDDSTFRWTNAVGAYVVSTNDEEHDLHIWMKEGGFTLGAIEVHIQGSGTTKVANATTSPHTENDRNPF